MRSRTVQVASAALIVLAVYGAAFVHLMRQRNWDISLFVVAGRVGVDPQRIPPALTVDRSEDGYDGIAYYRLALDPFTRTNTDFGITFDNPPYRQQRILYPLLVHVLSLGRPVAVPTVMVIVNLLAVVALTIGASLVAMQYGLPAIAGAVIPLYAGFFLAFSRNTTEIVAWALAIWAIHAIGRAHWKTAAIVLCSAVLARETTLMLALAMAADYGWRLVRKRERPYPESVFIAPLVVYAVWQLVLRSWWGSSGMEAGAVDPAVPFSGYVRVFLESLPRRTVGMRTHFAEGVFWAFTTIAVLFALWRGKTPPPWRLAWLAYLGMAATLAADVWTEQMSFMRVLSDLFVLSAVALFGGRAWQQWSVTVFSLSLSLYVVSHLH